MFKRVPAARSEAKVICRPRRGLTVCPDDHTPAGCSNLLLAILFFGEQLFCKISKYTINRKVFVN